MAHKNLLSDRRIKNYAESYLYRKPSKCWAMKKVRFTQKEIAEEAAINAEKADHIKLYVYKCRACHSWHLTKEPQ